MRFIIRTQGFSSTYQGVGHHIYNSNQKRDEPRMKLCQSQLLGTRVDQNSLILVLLLWCLFSNKSHWGWQLRKLSPEGLKWLNSRSIQLNSHYSCELTIYSECPMRPLLFYQAKLIAITQNFKHLYVALLQQLSHFICLCHYVCATIIRFSDLFLLPADKCNFYLLKWIMLVFMFKSIWISFWRSAYSVL